ncbi:sensor histidine kinase [Vibrio genomosp. F10]|uniref:sensor histidine kinase n=1 Tax=Vibrio genomosp. F10 TaxID=723171 RepID=UPI0003110D80|nr:HAMP domain-containing sensor histidine kinase [Vibrio genomosp. F10]OEF07308.1 two-component sensor histidine kinase [Vibrio genomosp. F10 str. 9ZB36]
MSVSNWAEQYCSGSSELLVLYHPEQNYVCQSKGLLKTLSPGALDQGTLDQGALDIVRFLSNLTPEQLNSPDFSGFSMNLAEVTCIDGLYFYRLNIVTPTPSNEQSIQPIRNKENLTFNEQERLLEKAQKELIELEKLASLGALVAGVTHEVNTPIGIGVTAASHLLLETKSIIERYDNKTMKKSQLEDFLEGALESGEIIQDNLMRASDLIKSFKQIAVEQTIDSIFDVNLKETVTHIKNSFHHKLKNKPVTFVNNVDSDLVFRTCSGKLNQIMTNLVNNSLIHGFDKGNKGSIEITAKRENGHIHICYFDTGSGVDDTILTQLFDPFFTTKREEGGTGLGLNIVYNIIKQQNGQVEVSHVKPSGLQFNIILPIEVNQ